MGISGSFGCVCIRDADIMPSSGDICNNADTLKLSKIVEKGA